MSKVVFVNAFSVNMLEGKSSTVGFFPMDKEKIIEEIEGSEVVSAIGHADTAAIVSSVLGVHLAESREEVNIRDYNFMVVAQYAGPRLPEGTTKLPEGATIQFWSVWIE